MSKTLNVLAAGGLLMGLLAAGPIAMAAEEGSTSGPTAGSTVKPSTAMQKENMKGQSGATTAQGGAPGVAGQPGNKNGPPAKQRAGNTGTESNMR